MADNDVYHKAIDFTGLSQDDLDELLAQEPDNAEVKAEYVRRGINPDTGEPLEA